MTQFVTNTHIHAHTRGHTECQAGDIEYRYRGKAAALTE